MNFRTQSSTLRSAGGEISKVLKGGVPIQGMDLLRS
jgi:hypothetical protein